MDATINKLKDYRIHTGLIEDTIKEKVRKKGLFRSTLTMEGKRKERPVTNSASQYEIKYLLGPNLSIIIKRLLPLEDIDRLYALNVNRISQIKRYSQLIHVEAGFDINAGEIDGQYFKDNLTILYNANKIDTVAQFHFLYDNSAEVDYSRNFNLSLVEFRNGRQRHKLGSYNPTLIYKWLFDMLQKEKNESNYYRWRKGLGFGFNKQTI